jgi:hypothetical protein
MPQNQTYWDSEAELELLRDLCRRDFWSHFLWCFGATANPKGVKWIDPRVHKPLADWFEGHVRDWLKKRKDGLVEQKHLAIIVHREVGKTTLISQAGQSWLHLQDPELSTYTGSEKLDLAAKIIGPIKAVMDGSDPYSLWSKLYGNWSGSARTWKTTEIVHAARKNTARRDPSLGTFGVETSIVGAHPDAIFYDDPISYDRLKTDVNWLGAVNDQVSSLIPVLQGDGLLVWVGTRYASTDHFGVALEDPEDGGDGIASLAGMATDSMKVHENGLWHVYFLAGRDQEGLPTTPKVWPEQRLKDYQRRSSLRYAAQVMNDPSISDTNPITREQLMQCVIEATEAPWNSMSYGIMVDLALWDGRQRINKDETVYQVWGYPADGSGTIYYIEGDGSMYWRDEDLSNRLVSLVQRYRGQGRRIKGLANELAVAGLKGVWATNLRNQFNDVGAPCPTIYEFSRGGLKKTQRIAAVTSFWVDGHVKLIKGAPGVDRLIDQMSRIGEMMVTEAAGKRSSRRKDDWVDAMADAFQPPFYQPMRRESLAPWDQQLQDRFANDLSILGREPIR